MKTRIEIIDNREITVLSADEGMEFIRKHDKLSMGAEIWLGIDYSTGVAREDRPDYYEEVAIEEQIQTTNSLIE